MSRSPKKTLILGGARSGKSALAQRWASERARDVCILATATASDPEMAARIEAHRRERPAPWRTREEPVQLARALREEMRADALVLVDCLTLWISNCLWAAGEPPQTDHETWRRERDAFLQALGSLTGEVILVSNEIGAGVVPDNAAARLFRDEQGWLNQMVAATCHEVFVVMAGLPLRLKPGARG